MSNKRKRITTEISSSLELAFFERLPKGKWPKLMRMILRDAIRTGRADKVKIEGTFDFDELSSGADAPLVSEGVQTDAEPVQQLSADEIAVLAAFRAARHMESTLKQVKPDPPMAVAVNPAVGSAESAKRSAGETVPRVPSIPDVAGARARTSPAQTMATPDAPTRGVPAGDLLKGFFGENT